MKEFVIEVIDVTNGNWLGEIGVRAMDKKDAERIAELMFNSGARFKITEVKDD